MSEGSMVIPTALPGLEPHPPPGKMERRGIKITEHRGRTRAAE